MQHPGSGRSGLFPASTPGRFEPGAFGLDAFEHGLRGVLAADQVRVLLAPFGGQFAAKGLGEDGLGEVVDSGLGGFDLLFDLVCELKKFPDYLRTSATAQANVTLSALEMRDRPIPAGPGYGGFSLW